MMTHDAADTKITPDQIHALQDVGALFYERGWSLGTSSNYSVVLSREPLRLLMTASGKDKRRLGEGDFVTVDATGQVENPASGKASAETLLHIIAAQQPGVGAVLHTHSVWATVLSDLYYWDGGLTIEDYEMLKGLAGVTTHEHSLWLDIFDNSQDMPALSKLVLKRFTDADHPLRHGFLLRRHGLYTWGRDLTEARRHVEVLEFLLEVIGRSLSIPRPDAASSKVLSESVK
jgi:methylthioribulose-1-phosphate dehydratase